MCIRDRTYWIELFDEYSANWAILLIAFVECISVSWFYGVDRIKLDFSTMVESSSSMNIYNKIFIWWKICWTGLTPALLLVRIKINYNLSIEKKLYFIYNIQALTIFSWVQSERLESGGYLFPVWSEIVGQILSTLSFIGIVAYALYAVYDAKKTNKVIIILMLS